MSKQVHNPHDKFFRETFSDPDRASAFLEEFLPSGLVKHLDIPSVKVLQESYMDSALKEYFSDLILQINLKEAEGEKVEVAFLFEHKSTPDKHVLIQVGFYMFAHWLKLVRQKKKLKLIIPLIYYQGKKKWKVPGLSKLFKDYPEELISFVPRLKHLLISLNEIPDEQIAALRNSLLAAALGAQKLAFNPKTLVEDFIRILRLFPIEPTDKNFLQGLVVYSIETTNLSEQNIAEAIKNMPQTIKKSVMTAYETLMKKGIEKGIKKGIEKGRIETQVQMILALYDDGINIQQIAMYAKITEKEVLKILKENDRLQ